MTGLLPYYYIKVSKQFNKFLIKHIIVLPFLEFDLLFYIQPFRLILSDNNLTFNQMSRPTSDQLQSVQKDAVISSLKKQLYDLKDKENEFIPLENEVVNIESKYDMLLDEKERIQSQHKLKLQINRKNILELRTETDNVRMQIHKSTVHIEEVLREIAGLKRTCQNRENQISSLLTNNQQLNAKNESFREQNKNQALKIRNLKEERNSIDLQNQRLLKSLEDSLQLLKTLEKEGRSLEAANNKLSSILSVAEKDNADLIDEMKSREDIVNATYKKLDNLNLEIDALREKTKKLEKECIVSQEDYALTCKNLQAMVVQNKEQTKRLKIYENEFRLLENDFDTAVLERDSLYNEHQSLSVDNKIYNDQIDKTLLEIMEAERMNCELQKELENYIVLDQEARKMLNREERMVGLLDSVGERLKATGNNISHLR